MFDHNDYACIHYPDSRLMGVDEYSGEERHHDYQSIHTYHNVGNKIQLFHTRYRYSLLIHITENIT